MDESLYEGREQSRVKHLILQRYLARFALIIGRHWPSITYVDCFSGPWKSQSEEYEDTSFAIAIAELRTARAELAKSGINIRLRAFFSEDNADSFAQLERYVDDIEDIEIEIRNQTFEDSIHEILGFIDAANTQTFPFVFIDPNGWTGFALDVIRPLLESTPCEVLINFMTQHIVRFINSEESRESFERLFGSADFADDIEGLEHEDRVDAAVFQYRDVIGRAGNFDFTGVAGILNPLKDRSHFHLIYLSRHPRGLDVFKDAEKKSMADMETARARAEQLNRQAKSKQPELFAAKAAPESAYYRSLRDRYRKLAIEDIDSMLANQIRISYDEAWKAWLRYPMVWESDLKEWIGQESPRIELEGLSARQRVPQRGKGHFLLRKPPLPNS